MIHNSSVIDKKARIGNRVKIVPFCYVGAEVKIDNDVLSIPRANLEMVETD